MTSLGQQLQAQGLSLLNMENKQRQQPKIAHEHGAGSQCLRCGPKCSGFDLHYWRKICKNCRCGKENHLVPEGDFTNQVVGQLLDDSFQKHSVVEPPFHKTERPSDLEMVRSSVAIATVPGEPASPLDWIPPKAEPHLALKYMEQLPPDQQPIVGSQAAVERKRALERQLPSYDLDPEKCKSLTGSEKQQMEKYVKQMKQFVVGQGLIQECPPRGALPPPPPQLDRILEQKMSSVNLQNPQISSGKSPSVSPKPIRSVRFSSPKPYVRFEDVPTTEHIRKMSTKPNANVAQVPTTNLDLPSPPLEMVQETRHNQHPLSPPSPPPPPPPPSFASPPPPIKSEIVASESVKVFDPVKELMDFIEEEESKKLPGRLKSPFLTQNPDHLNLTGRAQQVGAGGSPVSNMPNPVASPVQQSRQRPLDKSPVGSPKTNRIGQRSSGQEPASGGGRIGWPKAPLSTSTSASPGHVTIHQNVDKANARETSTSTTAQAGPKRLLTTDFDYVPENRANNNVTGANLNKLNSNPSAANNNLPAPEREHASPPKQNQAPAHQQGGRLSTVGKELPGSQTPVKYQQEIIQETEQPWRCNKCHNPIEQGTVAVFAERAGSDKCWHPQCFCCSICNERLADLIYFFVEGELFCGRHYAEKMNVPRCKACDELIFAAEYTQAEGANWHMNHFCCWLCDVQLAGKQYTPMDGEPHCLECYQKKYGKDCYECKKPILATETLVSHAEWSWHNSPNCFKCRQCSVPMANSQFFWKYEQVFCSRDCVVSYGEQTHQQQQARVILIP